MTAPPRVIHLDPAGPEGRGLEPLDLDPADFQSPLPVQNYYLYFEDEGLGLAVGIWDTTTMQEAFGPYPTDEFILVIEGSFAMIDGKGGAVMAGAGDSVCFRQGIPTSWKQEGYLRKIYLTLSDPSAEVPRLASAEGGVIVLAPPADPGAVLFHNDRGNMTVAHFVCGALSVPLAAAAAHELVQVLQGEVTISQASGAVQVFRPGEVFFIPRGTPCAWSVTGGLSAYRVSVSPPVALARGER